MKGLIRFSLNNPHAIIVMSLAIALLGSLCLRRVPVDILPVFKSPSVQVLTFRPWFILGEVNKPGQYEFSTGLTVVDAIAIAEGFTYRARKSAVFVTHRGDAHELRIAVTPGLLVVPGDTIRVGERYF